MLVLTRRSGESVMVGDDIVVTVLDVRADTVRLGIRAPRHIAVHREEVFEEIRAANRAAASPQDATIAELRRRLRTRGGAAVAPRSRPPGSGRPAGPGPKDRATGQADQAGKPVSEPASDPGSGSAPASAPDPD